MWPSGRPGSAAMPVLGRNGQNTAHKRAWVNPTPLSEYVEMPDGLSFAVPVTNQRRDLKEHLRKRPCRTNVGLTALASGALSLRGPEPMYQLKPCALAFCAGFRVLP